MASITMSQQCASPRAAVSARSLTGRSSRPVQSVFNRKVAVNPSPSRCNLGGLRVRAMAEEAAAEDDDFESRLGVLRGKRSKRAALSDEEKAAKQSDGATTTTTTKAPPRGQKRKGVRDFTVVGTVDEPDIDWGPEVVKYEGPPARGEVVANLAMTWTIVWAPLTITAIGRALWASYKITDKRVAVLSTSPLRTERIDIPIEEIVDVISIGRGIGLWGDMVVTLKNQEKVEIRSIPDFKDIEEHIKQRMGQADPEFAKL